MTLGSTWQRHNWTCLPCTHCYVHGCHWQQRSCQEDPTVPSLGLPFPFLLQGHLAGFTTPSGTPWNPLPFSAFPGILLPNLQVLAADGDTVHSIRLLEMLHARDTAVCQCLEGHNTLLTFCVHLPPNAAFIHMLHLYTHKQS